MFKWVYVVTEDVAQVRLTFCSSPSIGCALNPHMASECGLETLLFIFQPVLLDLFNFNRHYMYKNHVL